MFFFAGWPVLFVFVCVLYKYLIFQAEKHVFVFVSYKYFIHPVKKQAFLAQADQFTIIGRLLAARTSAMHLQQPLNTNTF